MDILKLNKNINKLASIVTNQKGCNDNIIVSQSELKNIFHEIEKSILDAQTDDEKRTLKLALARVQNSLQHANSLHKHYLFAFDMMNIEKLGSDMYRYKGKQFRASGILPALDYVLRELNVEDQYEYTTQFNRLDRYGLTVDFLEKITHIKEKKLQIMALNEPWHFHCLLRGAAIILKNG